MPYKHDFSKLSDYELRVRFKQVSYDLENKTYWNTDQVGRDHNLWKQMREEIKKRELEYEI